MDLLNSFINECAQESVGPVPKDTRTIFSDRGAAYVCDEPAKFDTNDMVSWLIYLVPTPCNEWRIMKHVREELSHPLEDEGVSVVQETWTSFPADLHTKML